LSANAINLSNLRLIDLNNLPVYLDDDTEEMVRYSLPVNLIAIPVYAISILYLLTVGFEGIVFLPSILIVTNVIGLGLYAYIYSESSGFNRPIAPDVHSIATITIGLAAISFVIIGLALVAGIAAAAICIVLAILAFALVVVTVGGALLLYLGALLFS